MKKCSCFEITPKKWYRIKVNGTRGTVVGQCLTVDERKKAVSFEIGKRETKTTTGPKLLIVHEDDIVSIYEVSPRYIETKERKLKGSIVEDYYDTFE